MILRGIEARTCLGRGTGHFRVTTDKGCGEEPVEFDEELLKLVSLLLGARVLRLSVGGQSAFVADADAAAVVRSAVGTHLKQMAVLRHLAVAPYVEMITYGAEAPGLMVAQHLFHGVVTVLARSRAVDNKPPHRLHIVHKQPCLIFLQQVTFREDFVLRDRNGEMFGKHNLPWLMNTRSDCYRTDDRNDERAYCLQHLTPIEIDF